MGLISSLLTLPLAPVRGLVWTFEQVVDEAEAQLHDPARIRAELGDAESALERGEIDEQTSEELERELLNRLHG